MEMGWIRQWLSEVDLIRLDLVVMLIIIVTKASSHTDLLGKGRKPIVTLVLV